MKSFSRLLAAATAAVLVTTVPSCSRGPSGGPSGGELHVGYMICNSLAETKARFEPMSAWLADVLGARIVPHYINTSDFEKEARKGYLQIAHTNSLLYVILKENMRWILVAGEKEGSRGARTAGAIFVPGGSPVRTLTDLKGKRVTFGPEMAPLGFLAPYHMLLESGIDPEADLAWYGFTRGSFTHEKVVYQVLYGGSDAGAVPLVDLENMEKEGKIGRDDLRLVATSEFVPYCTFSVAPSLPAEKRAVLERALLGLSRDVTAPVGNEVLSVLGRAGVDGYEKLVDADYDPIRKMARRVNMPPYQKY
jgi:ABC-type phosphate/phosphonate transport system substrate-binding protein